MFKLTRIFTSYVIIFISILLNEYMMNDFSYNNFNTYKIKVIFISVLNIICILDTVSWFLKERFESKKNLILGVIGLILALILLNQVSENLMFIQIIYMNILSTTIVLFNAIFLRKTFPNRSFIEIINMPCNIKTMKYSLIKVIISFGLLYVLFMTLSLVYSA